MKAEELFDGKITKEEQRFRTFMKLISFIAWVLFIGIVYLLLVLALETTDP